MDDITAFLRGINKVSREGDEEVEVRGGGEGLKHSIAEGGTEGKSKVITSCRYLEEWFQECSKKEGVV